MLWGEGISIILRSPYFDFQVRLLLILQDPPGKQFSAFQNNAREKMLWYFTILCVRLCWFATFWSWCSTFPGYSLDYIFSVCFYLFLNKSTALKKKTIIYLYSCLDELKRTSPTIPSILWTVLYSLNFYCYLLICMNFI